MTELEFVKIVKEKVLSDGALAVDFNTQIQSDGNIVASVIAIRGHNAHRYRAWWTPEEGVVVTYFCFLG